jgi:small ligand-binding sensory domain FIST
MIGALRETINRKSHSGALLYFGRRTFLSQRALEGDNAAMIRAAVGLSSASDSTRAALDAATQAIDGLAGQPPDWAVAFVTTDHTPDISELLGALSGALGTPYVAGCSASGVLASGLELESGPGIAVLAVSSDQLRATPFLFHDEGDQGLTAGIRLGQRLLGSRDTRDLLLVWPDPFHVRPNRLLHGLAATLGQVPVAGGAASSGSAASSPYQFCGEESSTAAVSGMRLGGRFRSAIGVTQGCRPLGSPVRVTGAHENLILEVEGRPALSVLRELAPDHSDSLFVGLLADPSAPDYRPGEYLIRSIVAADPDTGVLAIGEHVEEGQHILFARREAGAAKEDLSALIERLSPRRTGLDYRFGLYFNCLARGRSLYAENGTDSRMLLAAFPGLPFAGFFCSAEIGPLGGLNQLFTYTGVLVLVAE